VIYKYALDRIPRSKSQALYNQYVQFEKQFGDKDDIEDVVVGKRRLQYEAVRWDFGVSSISEYNAKGYCTNFNYNALTF
jgi:hypothetical protein